jgi:hypothetical protein
MEFYYFNGIFKGFFTFLMEFYYIMKPVAFFFIQIFVH